MTTPDEGEAAGTSEDAMREVNARDVRDQFEEYLDLAREEPIGIRKSGKLTAVLVSAEHFENWQRLEDAFWVARAQAADAGGELLNHDDAIRLLTERLKQSD